MDNKHEQLLNFILKRVQDGKVDEAKKLIQAAGEKCVTGTLITLILVNLFLNSQC